LLVDAVMGAGGKGAPLPGLEIHHVVADGAALERERGRARLGEQREVDAEALVRSLAPRDRLEHEVDGRALGDERERRGHVRQHADLGGDVELGAYLVEHREQRVRALGAVGRGVDADDGIAGAQQKAVEDARGDGAQIVGGMIGLQPHRQAPRQPNGVAEARHHRTLRRHHHQIFQPADLGDRRRQSPG
jgi:hypothetical protein